MPTRLGHQGRGSRGSAWPGSLPGVFVHQTCALGGTGLVPAGVSQPSVITAHVGSPSSPEQDPISAPHPLIPGAQGQTPGSGQSLRVAPRGLAEGRLPHGCAWGLPAPALGEVHEMLQGAREEESCSGLWRVLRGASRPQSRCLTHSPAAQPRNSPQCGDPSSPQVRSGARLGSRVARAEGARSRRPTNSLCPGEPTSAALPLCPAGPAHIRAGERRPKPEASWPGRSWAARGALGGPCPTVAAEAQSGPGPAFTPPARWSSAEAAQPGDRQRPGQPGSTCLGGHLLHSQPCPQASSGTTCPGCLGTAPSLHPSAKGDSSCSPHGPPQPTGPCALCPVSCSCPSPALA